jgi:hypothetical protein
MVLKLDVPFLYLKINKGDNLWFHSLWTLGGGGGGKNIIYVLIVWAPNVFFKLEADC